jgi:hypothetical protein
MAALLDALDDDRLQLLGVTGHDRAPVGRAASADPSAEPAAATPAAVVRVC